MLASFLDMLEVDPVARDEGLNCQIPWNFCEMGRSAKLDFHDRDDCAMVCELFCDMEELCRRRTRNGLPAALSRFLRRPG